MTHSTPGGRVFALDNLRAALVMLVIVHQVSLVYSGFMPFYYQEPLIRDPLTYAVLGIFGLTNQAWFMAALFYIAGYFTPDTYDRKGVGGFLAGRFLRLGVPLLVGLFVVEPLTRIGYFISPVGMTGFTPPISLSDYPRLIGLGPFWFVALLLIFAILYALWRIARQFAFKDTRKPAPGTWPILAFIVGLAAVAYFWRMLVPVGRDVSVFTDALSFPTIAYLPHYFALFVFGVMTRRNGWLAAATTSVAWKWFIASVVVTILLLPWALSGTFFQLSLSSSMDYAGNGTWQSALYAVWDSTLTVGLTLAALGLFQAHINKEGLIWQFVSRQSYTAYLIHAVIVVFIAAALSGLVWPAFAKFLLASVFSVTLVFCLAYLIRMIPGAKRIL